MIKKIKINSVAIKAIGKIKKRAIFIRTFISIVILFTLVFSNFYPLANLIKASEDKFTVRYNEAVPGYRHSIGGPVYKIYVDSNGKTLGQAFCLQAAVAIRDGAKYYLQRSFQDVKKTKILSNIVYLNWLQSNKTNYDYAITQLAIWHYLNKAASISGIAIDKINNVITEAKKLSDGPNFSYYFYDAYDFSDKSEAVLQDKNNVLRYYEIESLPHNIEATIEADRIKLIRRGKISQEAKIVLKRKDASDEPYFFLSETSQNVIMVKSALPDRYELPIRDRSKGKGSVQIKKVNVNGEETQLNNLRTKYRLILADTITTDEYVYNGKTLKVGDEVGQFESRDDGFLRINDLPVALYDLQEIEAPAGLSLNSTALRFKIVQANGWCVSYQKSSNINSAYLELKQIEQKYLAKLAELGIKAEKELPSTKVQLPENKDYKVNVPLLFYDRQKYAYFILRKYLNKELDIDAEESEQKIAEEGAEFELIDSEGHSVDRLITNERGLAASKLLKLGKYRLRQVKSKVGYALADDEEINISDENEVYYYDLMNRAKQANLKIVKIDKETGAQIPVPGVAFSLFKSKEGGEAIRFTADDGSEQSVFLTNTDGVAYFPKSLVYGDYFLEEVKSPAGYYLDRSQGRFKISFDDKAILIEGDSLTIDLPNEAQKGRIEIDKTADFISGLSEEYLTVAEILQRKNKGALYDMLQAEKANFTEDEAVGELATEGAERDSVFSNENGEEPLLELSSADKSRSEKNAFDQSGLAGSVKKEFSNEKIALSDRERENDSQANATVTNASERRDNRRNDSRAEENKVEKSKTEESKDNANTVEFELNEIAVQGEETANQPTVEVDAVSDNLVPDIPSENHEVTSSIADEAEVPEVGETRSNIFLATNTDKESYLKKKYRVINVDFVKDRLEGAEFVVRAGEDIFSKSKRFENGKYTDILLYKKGEEVERFISQSTPYITKDLPLGRYIIEELATPQPFAKSEPIEVILNEPNSLLRVQEKALNVHNRRQRFQVNFKKLFTSDERLTGISLEELKKSTVFALFNKEDIVIDKRERGRVTNETYIIPKDTLIDINCLNDDFKINFETYFSGEYYIRELNTHEAFYLADDQFITVDYEDSNHVELRKDLADVVNKPVQGKIRLHKVSKNTGEDLSGVKFSLYMEENGQKIKQGEYLTNDEGLIEINNLTYGKYYLEESAAKEGYIPLDENFEIYVNRDKDKFSYEVANEESEIFIHKKDLAGEELEGAKMSLLDSEGNIVDTWTSTKEAHRIARLKLGEKYILKEDLAPLGYASASSIEFTFDQSKHKTSLEMIDEIIRVEIKKIDSESKERVLGAKLALFDSEDNMIAQFISSEESYMIEGLKVGEIYCLKELDAPPGYHKAEDIYFKVKDSAEVQLIEMGDMKTRVKINKLDAESQNLLAGAELEIVDMNGQVVCSFISDDKSKTIYGLNLGERYILREKKAPTGYLLADPLIFCIMEEDKDIVINYENKMTKLIINKYDEEHKFLSGAQFVLREENGAKLAEWTSSEHSQVIKGLEMGKKYIVEEIFAPDGYIKSDVISFSLAENGEKEINIINKRFSPIAKTGENDKEILILTVSLSLSLLFVLFLRYKLRP